MVFFFQPKKSCHRIGGSVEIESLYSFLRHFLKKYLSRNLSADRKKSKMILFLNYLPWFYVYLAFLQRWWWRHERWWRSWIVFPHRLSFGIICGCSHVCNCTQQMALPVHQLWGGVARRRSENISGPWSSQSFSWREKWWVDCVCVALSTNTTHSSASFPPVTHPLCQILFENDCLLSVDGTDFCVAKSYERPYNSYKFKKSGLR